MVFDADKHAVSPGDVVAAQPHVHPRKSGQSRGFCDGESVVEAALVEPAVGIQSQERKRCFMPKGDFIELPTNPCVDQRGVPLGIPHSQIERFVVVVIETGPEFLLDVHGGLQTPIGRGRAHAVHHPRAEAGLQRLRFEKGRHILAGERLEQRFKIPHIHVAVEALGNDVLSGLTEQGIAQVRPQIVHHARAFVVGVAAVNVVVGHGRKGMKPLVLDVAFFQDKLLVVLDQIHKGLVSVFPLGEQVAAVFGRALFQPHVVVDGGRDQVTPPMVSKFMGKQVAVGEEVLLNHGTGVGDVGGDFEGAVGGQHVADPFPRIRTPPMLQRIDGEPEVDEFGLHEGGVRRLACQPDRDVPIEPVVHTFHVDKRAHCDGAEVRGDGVVQIPGALHGVSAELNALDKVTLVVRAPAACTFDVVSVGGPLDKVVKARVPHLPKVGGNGGQADAKVVNDVAGVIHATPIRIVVGLTPVPNLERHVVPSGHGARGLHVQAAVPLVEQHGFSVPCDAVHDKPLEVPPHGVSTSNEHVKINGGMGVHRLATVIGDIQKQVVVQDVKTVASGDARPHVVVGRRRRNTGCRLAGVLATSRNMAPLGQKGIPLGFLDVVESGQGGVLGGRRRHPNQGHDARDEKNETRIHVGHASKLGLLSLHETG